MSTKSQLGDRNLSRIVQRSLRNWELGREVRRRQTAAPPPAERAVADFVAVSRLAGAGGREVAEKLAASLGWPLFDHELLEAMAGDDAVRRRLYESMDEHDLGWCEETVRSLMRNEFPRNDYFHQLCRTILALGRQGSAVFLGRAADLILPRDVGVRIRIVASDDWCARHYAERANTTLEAGRRETARLEAERNEFLRNHFGANATWASRYDLVINRERFNVEQIVELIRDAMRMRGIGEAPGASTNET